MAFRLFIDEVGNSDLRGAADDDNIRFLSLTGIISRENLHLERITPGLNDLKQIIRVASGSREPIILYRREILRREGVFACLRDPDVESKFNQKLLQLISDLPYRVITIQIDKRAHLNTYGTWQFDPYHYCLHCLVERFVRYLTRQDSKGLVIIEPRSKYADKRLKISFQRFYSAGSEHLTPTVVQNRLLSKDLQFFPKSADIAGLQLADMIAHPSARHMRFLAEGIDPPNDFGTKVAKILIDGRYARNPKTGEIQGWGTKWLP
jgi:hypothetical protein